MKVSYAITVSTEVEEFSKLVRLLIEYMDSEDEIIVLVDESKGFSEDIEFFENPNVHYFYDNFQDNFADWKNKLNFYCTGDWILQLDADELPTIALIQDIHTILESNQVECIAIPRKNIVDGITSEDIWKWGWKVTEDGINWPDYQWRLYRNIENIRWKGRVHEKPVGFKTYTFIPSSNNYYLEHTKGIEKQRKQNNYYCTLQ